ncbi:MAG: tetratricopeptide repeat protein [Methylococcaceae bacterium]
MTLPFIGREPQLTELKHLINTKQGALFVITGKSGMGKSTLLRHIADIYANKGQSFIDINDVPPLKTTVEFLTHLAKCGQGLTETQKALSKIKGTYKNPIEIIASYKDLATETTQAVLGDNSENVNEESKESVINWVVIIDKWLDKLFKNIPEYIEKINKQKLGDPELFLLNALKKDCKKQPLIFIDTYERLQAAQELSQQKINSRYSKLNQHLTAAPVQLSLQDWLDNFIEFLRKHGAIVIIAGRKGGYWQTKAQSLPQFNDDDIINLISCSDYTNLQALLLDEQTQQALLSLLNRLSFNGIPLWLQLALNFVSLELANDSDITKLAQTSSIESLFAIPETESELNSINTDNARCKLALFKRVMQHNLDLEELAWQMALPRSLTKPILIILFAEKANLLRDSFIQAGLLSPLRLETDSTRLHDEIRDLLLSYAAYKGWLELEQTKNLHKQLADFFAQQYQLTKDALFLLEQLYHQLISDEQFNLEHINDAEILNNMAIVLEDEKQYQKMSQVFLRLIDIAPDYENAWFGLGIALFYLGKLEQACNAYYKQIEIKPNHEMAWHNLGCALHDLGKLEEAIHAYHQQVKIKPNHELAWYNLGCALSSSNKVEQACDAYRKQVEIKPNDERAWNNLGLIYLEQNKLEQAQESYSKALDINFQHVLILSNDAELALVQNDKTRCLQRITTASALIDNKNELYVILPFLAWLAEPEKPSTAIDGAIEKLHRDVKINWHFTDIEPAILRLTTEQQLIAWYYIIYFKGRGSL